MQSHLSSIDLSHHAYCLIANDSFSDNLISYLKDNYSISVHGNPDYFFRRYENFTIDDAKEIIRFHSVVPISSTKRKIIILSFDNITVEAQNALLKLLEESATYVNFFIIVPSSHLLLDTIKSRMQIMKIAGGDDDEVISATQSFLEKNIKERLDFVKKMIEDVNKEKKTKQYVVKFLDSLQKNIKDKGVKENIRSLEAVEIARKYINDRAPSLKMILEYVSLIVD